MTYMTEMGKKAKVASTELSTAGASKRNEIIRNIIDELLLSKEDIFKANALDIKAGREIGLSSALIDRLILDENRISSMAKGLSEIVSFPDPLGRSKASWKHENGMVITEVSVPLGVIGMIYESRPNVTADVAGLAIKSGNAVILRGGKEAINSNMAIADAIRRAIEKSSMNPDIVQLVSNTDRALVNELITMNDYVDVLIPRGGRGLKKAIIKGASVPVIETGEGLCHTYIDASADEKMALDIIINAKTQRTGVCNAMETLLVNREIAEKILPKVDEKLFALNFEMRACEESSKLMPHSINATEEDWATEHLDAILSIKVVENDDEAIGHINLYGSGHSEAIVTSSYAASEKFLEKVDAAAVYVNASTRFTDGGVFGFGGEIGISTQKLHARGPMGVEALTTKKFTIRGSGQIR